MPGYGGRTSRTHRIPLEPFDGSNNWVEIKDRLPASEQDAIDSAGLYSVSRKQPDGQPGAEQRFDFTARRVTLFRVAIVAWSLTAEDGDAAPMPLNDQTFRDLWGTLADWLSDQIQGHYKHSELTEEELGKLERALDGALASSQSLPDAYRRIYLARLMRCRPSEVDQETYEDQRLYMSYLKVERDVAQRQERRERTRQASRDRTRARGRRR